MKNKMNVFLEKIHHSLKTEESVDPSLMLGKSGIFLFNCLYSKYFPDNKSKKKMDKAIQKIAEMSLVQMHPSLCTGKAGINWFFTYLNHIGLISREDRDFLCDDDSEFEKLVLDMLGRNNYDYLHGAIGIAYYLLYDRNYTNHTFFVNFFNGLQLIFEKSDSKEIFPTYNPQDRILSTNQVNLGLAHGIPSVLKFCLECYQKNICKDKTKAISMQIVKYLKKNVNSDKSKCFFPQSIVDNVPEPMPSRMGWCYGDLSLGYILYQAGIILKDNDTKKFSLELLTHTTQRRSPNETAVVDCGICHGSAGIAHIYNKIWHYTNQEIFKDACNFWMEETLGHLEGIDWKLGYKKYNNYINDFEVSHNFLDGSAGIGLVLLSYLYEDFSWDYPIMLN